MTSDDDMANDEKLLASYCAALREGRINVKYPPILSEPLYCDPDRMPLLPSGNVHDLVGSKRRQNYADKIQAESDARWHWLFAIYGINDDPRQNPNCAVDLLMALVNQHVPGLRITSEPPAAPKKRQGGQRKYNVHDDAYLVWIVDYVRKEMAAEKGGAKVTKDAAIKRALKKDKFGKLALKPNGQKMSETSMITRYYEAERRWKDHPRNKKLLLDGGHHTPQSLAKRYWNVVVDEWQATTNNPDHSS